MKKIFTLLFAVTIAMSVSAQYNNRNQGNSGYGHDNGKNVPVYNDNRNDNHSNDRFNFRERDMKVAAINREYDAKVREVKSRFFMSRYKKEQQISSLEAQRNAEIKRVFSFYSNDRRDDRDGRNHW
ncbi:MAG: hypothetical protein ABJA78_07210 [Ferruginibacter sp.]